MSLGLCGTLNGTLSFWVYLTGTLIKEPPLALINLRVTGGVSHSTGLTSRQSGWTANARGTNKFTAPKQAAILSCVLLGELQWHRSIKPG